MTPTVLLVEDEPLLREVTSEDLQDLGFVTLGARDAQQAVEFLESDQALAVMVTDIQMPGGCDGWELAHRARELRPELPIIYLSGYSEEGMEPVAGAVFVGKPYRITELAAALAQLGLAPAT